MVIFKFRIGKNSIILARIQIIQARIKINTGKKQGKESSY
jgi:hypothetical protein